MSHLLSIKIRVIQSNLVNLKSRGTRDLFDTSLQIRIHIGKLLSLVLIHNMLWVLKRTASMRQFF